MKLLIPLVFALAATEFGGPPLAGAAGMKATAGFDGADVVCILIGIITFFLVNYIASYF